LRCLSCLAYAYFHKQSQRLEFWCKAGEATEEKPTEIATEPVEMDGVEAWEWV
jgi:hypothetical protein